MLGNNFRILNVRRKLQACPAESHRFLLDPTNCSVGAIYRPLDSPSDGWLRWGAES